MAGLSRSYARQARCPAQKRLNPATAVEQELGRNPEMDDILARGLQHDEQAVLSSVEMALETKLRTRTNNLSLLHRLVDAKSFMPAAIRAPQVPTLVNEPEANVMRYDALSKAGRAMHHNSPSGGAIVIMLRQLNIDGMAQAVRQLTEQGAFEAAIPTPARARFGT